MSIVYCAECGFQNPEAANYCSRCGSLLARGESSGEITQTFSPEEIADLEHDPVVGLEGPALVVRAGGGRAGESFKPTSDRTRIGRSPDCEVFLDDVTVSRNHAVLVRQDERVRRRGPGLAERDLRQSPAHRQRAARERRRAPDRQIPDDVHRMTSTARQQQSRERLLRIGEVVRRLGEEFPDISISKIRYLEDEGLVTPRRTQGGYRLFSEEDVDRLQMILRLQRDEFLPLRVIRDELDAPGAEGAEAAAADRTRRGGGRDRPRRALQPRRHHPRAREGARGLRLARRPAAAPATSAIRSRMPMSQPPVRSSPATASTRVTCARSGPQPAARRR